MTDLFVSEILILAFFIPVFLRPFSKSLKKVPAILLLPLFAIILCILTIIGQGVYFSNCLILLFSIIVFIYNLPKFFSFFSDLSTSIYSISEIVFSLIFLILSGLLFFLTWKFAPYTAMNVSGKAIVKELCLEELTGKSYGKIYLAENAKEQNSIIILLPNMKKTSYESNTVLLHLLENSYEVICIEHFEELLPIAPKNFYNFLASCKKLYYKTFKRGEEKLTSFAISANEEKNFIKILQAIIKKYANARNVYIFSEGMYSEPLIRNFNEYFAESVNAAFFLCDEDFDNEKLSTLNAFFKEKDTQVFFSEALKNCSLFFYQMPKSALSEFAEMPAEDLLATVLLHGKIDIGRKRRKELAEVFEKFIYVKEN